MWHELRNNQLRGYKFRRQHAISSYIVDFFCLEKELVVEIDGGIFECEKIKEKNVNRKAELERLGLTVIRFSNEEVMNDIVEVIIKIEQPLKAPYPSP